MVRGAEQFSEKPDFSSYDRVYQTSNNQKESEIACKDLYIPSDKKSSIGAIDKSLLNICKSGSVPESLSYERPDYIGSSAIMGSGNVIVDASKILSKKITETQMKNISNEIDNPDMHLSFPHAQLLPDGSIFVNNFHNTSYYIQDKKLKWEFCEGSHCNNHFNNRSYKDGIINIGVSDRLTDKGKICAVSTDGRKIWEFATRGKIMSSPVAGDDNTIYVGDDKGWLYAVKNGTLLWECNVESPVYRSPCQGPDGKIYVSDDKGGLNAIREGKILWKLKLGKIDDTPIRIIPEVGSDGTIYAMSYWKRDLFGNKSRDDCTIYAIKEEKNLFNSSCGKIIWKYKADGLNIGNIYGGQSRICMGSDDTIYFGNANNLIALKNGKEIWRYKAIGILESTPVLGQDGTVYIGGLDGKFYAVKDGKCKWDTNTGSEITDSPAIKPDGTIFIGSGEHSIYEIKRTTMEERYDEIVKESADKDETKSRIETGDDFIIINGIKLPVKK